MMSVSFLALRRAFSTYRLRLITGNQLLPHASRWPGRRLIVKGQRTDDTLAEPRQYILDAPVAAGELGIRITSATPISACWRVSNIITAG